MNEPKFPKYRYFNADRELIIGEPCEFWDDVLYQATMDKSIHMMLNPRKCDFPECAERELKKWRMGDEQRA